MANLIRETIDWVQVEVGLRVTYLREWLLGGLRS